MTKAGDIKTLIEAAEIYDAFSLASASDDGLSDKITDRANAILCRVVSSLMAGEGEKEPEAIDVRSWNAALDAALRIVRDGQGLDGTRISALRKPAQEEGK